jgi:hypothetical protein
LIEEDDHPLPRHNIPPPSAIHFRVKVEKRFHHFGDRDREGMYRQRIIYELGMRHGFG